MNIHSRPEKPRILIVTPEITYLPAGMGNMANKLTAKGGGLADVSATLVSILFDQGVDIHVALPNYRKMFGVNVGQFIHDELRIYKNKLPEDRIHLAEDRLFYYRDQVYDNYAQVNYSIALAFQREVINNIVPRVRPDLIHCNDWMTGLIPAMARKLNIPCLFTVHNIHTVKILLNTIESIGIDAAEFWEFLYYEKMASSYEVTREQIPVDFLASGIFSAHFINTVSPTFLDEIVEGRHSFVDDYIRQQLSNKVEAGCAVGILNSPDPSYHPKSDPAVAECYDHKNHRKGKRTNKKALQERLGLDVVDSAPIFFWPSRLDPVQKGCQLLTDILYRVISEYWDENLQLVVVANGPYQCHFHDIVRIHDFYRRVAVCDYDDPLSRLAYAASDFLLMPSKFEPCGLPQMICQIYGSLPVAHNTGGIRDTVEDIDIANDTGSGFLFDHYDSSGLLWAIGEAMSFHRRPAKVKDRVITRVMKESSTRFNSNETAQTYHDIYKRVLDYPL